MTCLSCDLFKVPSTPHQHFFEAGKLKLCEDTRGSGIKDSTTCKYAAKRLNKTFISSLNDPEYPQGCFVDWKTQGGVGMEVHYNENVNSLKYYYSIQAHREYRSVLTTQRITK